MKMTIEKIDNLIAGGKFDEARSYINDIISSAGPSLVMQSILYARAGKSYTAQWRFYNAVPLFEKALQLLDAELNRDEEWQFHYINITLEYCYALHTTRAFSTFAKIVEQLKGSIEKHGNNDQKIQYLKIVYMDMLVRYRWFMLPDEALIVCHSITELAKAQNNTAIEIDGLNNLGFTYMLNWQPEACRKYALQALGLINNKSNDEAKSMAYCYITNAYRLEKNLKAVEQWHKILSAHVEANQNATSKMLSDSALAWICYMKSDFGPAEKLSLQVFAYMTQHRFPFLPVCSVLLIALYLRKNDLASCIRHVFILLHPNVQGMPGEITTLVKAGLREYYLDHTTKARQHFTRAAATAERLGYL
ncbi:MAG: hypothetical protein H3C48_18680 [Chitinophagaceae bacterium]|nr:hypothetical protein [Chitinophagaceae bacterium]